MGKSAPSTAVAGHSSGALLAREPSKERRQLWRGAEAGALELGRDFRTLHQALSNRPLEDSDGADNFQSVRLGCLPASRLVDEREASSHLDRKENGIPLVAVQMAEPII